MYFFGLLQLKNQSSLDVFIILYWVAFKLSFTYALIRKFLRKKYIQPNLYKTTKLFRPLKIGRLGQMVVLWNTFIKWPLSMCGRSWQVSSFFSSWQWRIQRAFGATGFSTSVARRKTKLQLEGSGGKHCKHAQWGSGRSPRNFCI